MDEADLALIESNHPSPLVQRLIHEIRRWQDEAQAARADQQYLADQLREYDRNDR